MFIFSIKMDEVKEKLYPRLDATTENNYTNIENGNDVNDYRIKHIKDIRNYLEKDSENRRSLSKKYSKITNALNYTNYALNSISAASGIASVSTLPTITLIPLSIVLGGISIGTSSLSILSSKLNKKLTNKESKHRDIYNLSENKLNLMNSMISKALEDGKITNEEFDIILKEEKHYRLHKEDIRRKNKKIIFNEDKIKNQVKNELKESLLKPVNNLVDVIKKQ